MGKTIRIRNVPEGVQRRLKVRAANAGLSVSDFLARHVRELAERPTLTEMVRRLSRGPRRPALPVSAADLIRADRGD